MINACIFLGIGVALLVVGAEVLIRGATSLALRFGVSTLVIGLTVVAFGTSAPELFVSVDAALLGVADVAVGNIVGSNICNVLVIIGIAALIVTVNIGKAVLYREMPLMLMVLAAMWFVSQDQLVSGLEGAIFFVGIISYLVMNYVLAKRSRLTAELQKRSEEEEIEEAKEGGPIYIPVLLVVAGLLAMVFGARWIVENAVYIAKVFMISDLVIGITLVAVGTSLPELATTVVAARRQQADLVVGNAIGSNIFNVLCVIGITSMIQPLVVREAALSLDYPFMFFSCLLVWLSMLVRKKVGRSQAVVMLGTYFAYVVYLFSDQIGL